MLSIYYFRPSENNWGVDDKNNKSITFTKAFDLDGQKIISIIGAVRPDNSNLKTIFYPDNQDEYIWNLYKKGGKRTLYGKPSIYQHPNLGDIRDKANTFKIVEFRLPIYLTQNSPKGLNAPGDVYIITDTRTKPRKELEETAIFKKFDIRPFDGSEFAADGSVVWFPVKDLNFDRVVNCFQFIIFAPAKTTLL